MTAPIPDYVAAARACFDVDGFRQVWTKAEANGHLDEVLRARLTPIGEALANAEMTAAPELPAVRALTVRRCEAGCGCRYGTDDPDRLDCCCDGPCTLADDDTWAGAR